MMTHVVTMAWRDRHGTKVEENDRLQWGVHAATLRVWRSISALAHNTPASARHQRKVRPPRTARNNPAGKHHRRPKRQDKSQQGGTLAAQSDWSLRAGRKIAIAEKYAAQKTGGNQGEEQRARVDHVGHSASSTSMRSNRQGTRPNPSRRTPENASCQNVRRASDQKQASSVGTHNDPSQHPDLCETTAHRHVAVAQPAVVSVPTQAGLGNQRVILWLILARRSHRNSPVSTPGSAG